MARSRERLDLLGLVDRQCREFDRERSVQDFDVFRRRAMDVLASGECRRAFGLEREDPCAAIGTDGR